VGLDRATTEHGRGGLRRAIPAAGALKEDADLRDPLNDPLKGSLIKSMSLGTVGVANFIKILLSRT
jgi:hypothetical protein